MASFEAVCECTAEDPIGLDHRRLRATGLDSGGILKPCGRGHQGTTGPCWGLFFERARFDDLLVVRGDLEAAELEKVSGVCVTIDAAAVADAELAGDERGAAPADEAELDQCTVGMVANDAFAEVRDGRGDGRDHPAARQRGNFG